jgi:3-dehydroquinate dehydratase/shikimate dehydrogenase
MIGACNTVYRREGRWFGENTDYEGFLSPIRAMLQRGEVKHALVVGAGGAARTVVFALRDHGVGVSITNRTPEKARRLAEEAGCGTVPWSSFDGTAPRTEGPYELVVQTTSVGMEPNEEGDPLPGYVFGGGEVVYDIIYTPEKTTFLERAEESGCRIVGGAEMLGKQAVAQFRLFTRGVLPPGE